MKNIFLLLCVFIGLKNISNAQIVNIPDAHFKAYLVGTTSINTNSDSEIQVSEASTYTGSISVSNRGINDLTGIEEFTSLTVLEVANNPVTSLNVSSNTNLTRLLCDQTSISTLNLSKNIVLKELYCSYCHLTSLNISTNTLITFLQCSNNQLTSLNTSYNTALFTLICDYNQLTNLDVSSNTALSVLECNNNQLTSLNILSNTALSNLRCDYNQLISLNVSSNTTLSKLQCNHNQLTSLDVSKNHSLSSLDCSENLLTVLNVKNGNNNNFITGGGYVYDICCTPPQATFNAISNANLQCIQVDDAAYSVNNWSNKIDSTASFSLNCNYVTEITESTINNTISIFPNPNNGNFKIESIKNIISLEISDTYGSIVLSQKPNINYVIINLSELCKGVCFVKIITTSSIVVEKIIIQ